MEIVSDLNESCRAPPIHQADKPVHDEATKYPMIEARLLAIRDLTQSNPAQALCFIKAFEVQERVKPALEKLHSWTPSRKIRAVIEAACRDLYPVDDIEGAFYTYGGMHGIVALAAIVDAKVPIFILWDGIKSQLVRKWVVWRISGHARNTSNSWVTQQQKAWPNSLGSSWKYINWTNKATGEAEHPYLGIIERRKISRAACDGQHPYPARELHKQDDVAQQTKPNGDQQAIDDAGQTLLTPPPEHDRQPKRPKLDHCNTLQDSPLRSSSIQYTADEQYLYHNPQENKTSLKSVSFTNPLPTIDFITNRSNMPKPPIFTENQSPNCLISKTQGRPPPLQQPQHQIWRPELLTDLFCATTDLSPQRGWQSCTSPNQDGTRFPLALNMTLQEMSTSPVSCYGQSIHESLPSTTLPVIPSESHGSHSSPVLSNAIAAFEGLNPHVKNLAMLLAFLGDADIPKRMLYQAAKPSCTFNRTGEFDPVPAPDLGPLFGQSPMLDVVLQQLQSQGHIQYDPLAESFRVVPGIRVHIHSTTPGHIVQNANYQVSRLIFHTFPTNPDDGPDLYLESCSSQLPHLQHISTFFDRRNFINQFAPSDLPQVAAVFLSSSVFAGPEWKRTALTIAKMAIDSGPGDELLSGKWRLRAQVISRLYPAELGNYHVNDAGWNDLQGNQTLFEVQNLIFSGDFDYAWQLLEKLQSLLGPSTLEQRVRHKIDLFKSKICRLKGDFAAALEHLKGMPSAIITYKGLIPNYRSLLMELYCELGKTDDAACWIPAVDITSLSWLGLKGSGRRISLAAANTRFMEGFNMLGKDRMAFDRANELLHAAKMIYKELDKTFQDLPPSRVTHFRQFSVSAGLAMIAHLESHDQSENLKEAYTRWQSTLVVAERMRKCCAWDPGFAETVIAFSMSDITHRLGWREQTAKLMKEGKCLYLKTGRQFGWFALGTVWFDAVGDWLEGAGFSRIDERLDDWRSKRQNCNAK